MFGMVVKDEVKNMSWREKLKRYAIDMEETEKLAPMYVDAYKRQDYSEIFGDLEPVDGIKDREFQLIKESMIDWVEMIYEGA